MNVPRSRSILLICALSGALSAGGAAAGAPSDAPEAVPPELSFAPYEVLSADAPADEAQRAGEIVGELIDQRPYEFTGVAINGARSLLVTVPRGADVGMLEETVRSALAREDLHASIALTLRRVKYSQAEIEKIQQEIAEHAAPDGEIVGVGRDPFKGVAVVYATERSGKARSALKARYGDAIIFRQRGKEQFVDRNFDDAPHYAGAGYLRWPGSHSHYYIDNPSNPPFWCSTSFAVQRGSARYMLTAGHCMRGSSLYNYAWASGYTAATPFPPASYFLGSLYTTTFAGTDEYPADGTQDSFGDWALLGGSTYAPYVYNCSNTTGACTALKVGAVSWVTPVVGAAACTSGRTTGQICRYRVRDAHMILTTVSGAVTLRINHVANMFLDANFDGVQDVYPCRKPLKGDSGGAVYQGISGRPGYVRAMGMITASGWTSCEVWYTKLSGVRAWDPSITMPLAP